METEKENGWRDQKEPRQTMQKKDNAPNNQPKKNQKMEDKKKGSLQPRNCLHSSASKGTRSNRTINTAPHHLSQSPSSRLIRGLRPMTPTTSKMIQWIGGPRAMSSANSTRTVLLPWAFPRWKNDAVVAEGIIESPPRVSRIATLNGEGLVGGRRQCHRKKRRR